MRQLILSFIALAGLATSTSVFAAKGDIEYLNSGKVLPATLPFSEAVRVGNTLYLSGQLGIVPGSMKVIPGGIKEEAKQAMQNIRTSLEAHGYAINNLVKCSAMLADMADWPAFNEVYKTFFIDHYPARSAFGVGGLALGARVEIECVAAVAK
ncbi:MAG TPA: Rid family detoxifying hydrolase [Rudaea sp.]|jgi:reactive intermediate/imine deaminase